MFFVFVVTVRWGLRSRMLGFEVIVLVGNGVV